jgi:hypothetical protein
MGTGSWDEFQEAGTSLTRAMQYHGATLEGLVGAGRHAGRGGPSSPSAINSTRHRNARRLQTQTQTQTQAQTQIHTQTHRRWVPTRPSPRLHAAVGCIGPWAAASARPRPCSCMPARRLLHQSRLRLPSPWFPSLLHMPALCQFQKPQWAACTRASTRSPRCTRAASVHTRYSTASMTS